MEHPAAPLLDLELARLYGAATTTSTPVPANAVVTAVDPGHGEDSETDDSRHDGKTLGALLVAIEANPNGSQSASATTMATASTTPATTALTTRTTTGNLSTTDVSNSLPSFLATLYAEHPSQENQGLHLASDGASSLRDDLSQGLDKLLAASQQLASPAQPQSPRPRKRKPQEQEQDHQPNAPISRSHAPFSTAGFDLSLLSPELQGVNASLANPLGVGTSTQVQAAFQLLQGDIAVSSVPENAPSTRYVPVRSLQTPPWSEVGLDEKKRRLRSSLSLNTIGAVGGTSRSKVTTVLCLHASVAQKSYANEKRFLSPPPMVRIDGPIRSRDSKPRLVMTIVADGGERSVSERVSAFDQSMRSYFRGLYVGGTSKAKTFSLQLSMHSPASDPSMSNNSSETALPPPFATFESSEISILSKPSKKTAKARNTTSCIFAGSTIALHNRINAQTVRTKYMTIDDDKLAARSGQWSAFSIHVLRRSELVNPSLKSDSLPTTSVLNSSSTVTYGSEVMLTDLITGVSSEPLIVRKMENKRVILDASGPVSQLQKLAFCRIVDGQPIYLTTSVDGLDANGQPFNQPDGAKFRQPGKRRKKNELPEDDDAGPNRPFLTYKRPSIIHSEDPVVSSDEQLVDDDSIWTVIGINSFSYTFFNLSGSADQYIPSKLITPFPIISSPPVYDEASNCLTLDVSDFRTTIPENAGSQEQLEVWVGDLGPLEVQFAPFSIGGRAFNQDELMEGQNEKSKEKLDTIIITLPPLADLIDASLEVTAQNVMSQAMLEPPLSASNGENVDSRVLDDIFTTPSHAGNSLASLTTCSPPGDLSALSTATQVPTASSSSSLSSAVPAVSLPSSAANFTWMSTPELASFSANLAQTKSLPLLFVKPSDGLGYLSGRWIVVEKVPENPLQTSGVSSWTISVK